MWLQPPRSVSGKSDSFTVVDAVFNAGSALPALGDRQFYFAELEPGLRPESVLDTLAGVRG